MPNLSGTLKLVIIVCALGLVPLTAAADPAGSARPATNPSQLPPQIEAFRQQLWAPKPPGQTFQMTVSEQTMSEIASWALAEHPELPFSEPQIKIYPGGLLARGVAEVLGQRIGVQGLVRVTLSAEGRPQFEIEEITLAGVETTEIFLSAVRSALTAAQEKYLTFAGVPLKFKELEFEIGEVTLSGVFKAVRKRGGQGAGKGSGQVASSDPSTASQAGR